MMEIKIKIISRKEADDIKLEAKPVRIGSLCSECADPTARVMQSYVYSMENIISMGMFEKAQMAAEVMAERGDDPVDSGENVVFPLARKAVIRFEKGEINRVQLVKSLQAADTAMKVFIREAQNRKNNSMREDWPVFLKEGTLKYCGLMLP